MTDLKQINVRIPADLHAALAAHKEATGEDKSDVVRRGIELALETSRENGSAAHPPSPLPDDEAAAAGATAASPPAEPEHREGSGSGDSTSDSPSSDEGHVIDLPTWLAGRTGMPRALCRLRVLAGHVTIDGQRYQDERVPVVALQRRVTLDGTPV